MLGPRPSSAAAPSIWYAAVLVPNRKPGGSWGYAPPVDTLMVTPLFRRTLGLRGGTSVKRLNPSGPSGLGRTIRSGDGAPGDQHAWVQHTGRVELGLHGPQDADADLADLIAEPRLVVGADRVVVGDRGAGRGDRVTGSGLRRQPLLDRIAGLSGGGGEVQRAARLVDVRDVAEHQRRDAIGAEHPLEGGLHVGVQVVDSRPEGGGLHGLHEDAEVEHGVTEVRRGEPAALPGPARLLPQVG